MKIITVSAPADFFRTTFATFESLLAAATLGVVSKDSTLLNSRGRILIKPVLLATHCGRFALEHNTGMIDESPRGRSSVVIEISGSMEQKTSPHKENLLCDTVVALVHGCYRDWKPIEQNNVVCCFGDHNSVNQDFAKNQVTFVHKATTSFYNGEIGRHEFVTTLESVLSPNHPYELEAVG